MLAESGSVAGEHANAVSVLQQLANQPPTDVSGGTGYQAERAFARGIAQQRQPGSD